MEDMSRLDEGIVLCGGLGKRLRKVVKDVPKPMADIGGKPFLAHLLDYLDSQSVSRVVLAVGYKRDVIQGYFGGKYRNIDILYSVEDSLLGTGGAIREALKLVEGEYTFVFNGDTLFRISLSEFYELHIDRGADVSIALRWVADTSRYGRIEISNDGEITSFSEKGMRGDGYVNAGVYILHRDIFRGYPMGRTFSFERDFLQLFCRRLKLFGFAFDAYFIDIGIPEDYNRAKLELT